MNNEILEKIEEYNNGGLFNEPATFNSKVNHIDAATLFNLFAPPIGSGFKSFKDKIIELSVADTVDTTLVREDPAGIENYIREEFARKIAKQLIEEDLIQIQSDEDVKFKNTTFRARVKVIQE